MITTALNDPVPVAENGRRRTIPKGQQAMITQLVNRGASGDTRSIQLLLKYMDEIDADRASSRPAEDAQPAMDAQLFMLERLTIEERQQLRRLVARAQGDPPLVIGDEDASAAIPETSDGVQSRAET